MCVMAKFRCSRCHNKHYDSIDEQRADWQQHRKTCFEIDANLFFDQSPTIYGVKSVMQEALSLDLFVNYMKLLDSQKNNQLSIEEEILFYFYSCVVKMILSDPVSGTPNQDCEADLIKAHELMSDAHIDDEYDLVGKDDCHYFVIKMIDDHFYVDSLLVDEEGDNEIFLGK